MGLRHDGINVPGKHRQRQRPDRDDGEPSSDELNEWTVEDLRELAREEDINLHGADVKSDIVDEIEQHETDEGQEPEPER